MKRLNLLTFSLGLFLALPVFAEMLNPPAPVGEAKAIELTATVEDLDLDKRLVTLKGSKGAVVTTEVGPDVKNLDQVKVGDVLNIQYYLAVVVSAQKVGDDAKRAEDVLKSGGAAAAAGEFPAGVVGREVRETVEILGIDPYKKSIAFRPADGKYREVSMDAPHLEGRLEAFKEGDMVAVVFREALAISVEPK